MKNKKTVRKVLALLMAAATLGGSAVTVLPAVSSTDGGIVANAAEYGDFEYVGNDDGGIMIIGYTGSDTEVVIPNKINGKNVTSIGYGAFEICSKLTSITIPNSVTSIENRAFYWCKNLRSIIIPNSVTSIESYAFEGCSSLTSITIPDSVTSIGSGAFRDCSSLTRITIGNSVTSIEKGAFFGCSSLTSITIPDSVTSIGGRAFIYCSSLTSISIPDSVTSIEWSAFYNTAWYNKQPDGDVYAGKVYYTYKGEMPENTSVTIKEGTKGIAGMAFYGCTSLTSISIPNSVMSIGNNAFYDCTSLTSISIPDSVTSIGSRAFNGTAWYNNQPDGDVYAGKVYYTYKGTMPENTSVTIKEGTKGIADYAFYDCSSLTNITIPDSVTSIGEWAFEDCESLTSITIPDSVTSIEYEAFGYYYDDYYDDYKKIENFTIYGKTGSAAETYAKENGFKFIDIDSVVFANGISLNKTALTLETGATETLTATVTPDNATDKTVTWLTSNSKVATVKNGKVTAVAAGTATITAKTSNGKVATCKVTVKNPTTAVTKTEIKTVTLKTTSYTYDGTAKKPAVTVKDTSGKTVAASNYTVKYTNNTKAGKATVTITGKGNYSGKRTKYFTINAKSTAKLTTKLSATSYIYNGKAKTPTVTVKDGKTTLKKGTDYSVTYSSNKAIGTAKVTIKGKGNYIGTITKTFKIVPKTATLKTATSPKTKQLKATWAKDKTVTGYQIQYSTNSKFKSGNKTKTITKNKTTSATLTGLTKGKIYYVRVRAYKTVGKTKVYGAYSAVKKVKIK